MFDIKDKPKQVERAMLVGVYKEPEQKEEFESLLAELDSLVDTLEIPVIERLLVRVKERNKKEEFESLLADRIPLVDPWRFPVSDRCLLGVKSGTPDISSVPGRR